MIQILRPLHTAVVVRDVAQSAQFYETVLGLQRASRSLNYAGVWYQVGEYQLHLIEDPTITVPRPNAEKWGRNPHLALAIADVETAIRTLTAQGYPVQRSASGRPACFTADPDGNVIELTQVS